jgi:hypothetical protein
MDRRPLNKTGGSITSPLPEDAATAEAMLLQLSINPPEDPKSVLNRFLSVKFIIPTAFPFAQRQQQAPEDPELRVFRDIGVGTCATVFDHTGTGQAIKKQKSESLPLLQDYRYPLLEIKLPKPKAYIPKTDTDWWDANKEHFPERYNTPANIIVSERIMPLPKIIRDALVNLYAPPGAKDKWDFKNIPENKDCLARVYLGKRRRQNREKPSQFFSLRNFNLHVDQMEELRLDAPTFSNIMADALAVLYWEAKILPHPPSFKELEKSGWGTAVKRNFKKRSVHMWLLDFSLCHQISMNEQGVEQAIVAFFKNDPYYPRPGSNIPNDQFLWTHFSERYRMASKRVLGDGNMRLPNMFIKMANSEGERRLAGSALPSSSQRQLKVSWKRSRLSTQCVAMWGGLPQGTSKIPASAFLSRLGSRLPM